MMTSRAEGDEEYTDDVDDCEYLKFDEENKMDD